MGRPKGSKNKPKPPITSVTVHDGGPQQKWDAVDAEAKRLKVKPKRTRKAKGEFSKEKIHEAITAMDKLKAAGLTIDDLKEILGQPKESNAADKAELKRQMMQAPISPAEIAKLRKEALANMAKVKDPQLVVQEAVDQVIKPNWANTIADGAGLRHFLVKAMRNGDSVSFDKEKWDLALKQAGIRGVLNTCKPEGSAEVDPQANQGGGSMNIWRVMIG